MRGCFLLQRYFSRLGHALALELKSDGLLDSASAYVYTRHAEAFLRSRQELRYVPLLVDEDMYEAAEREPLDTAFLESMESEHGFPHLTPCISVDRTLAHSMPPMDHQGGPLFPHDVLLRHLQVRFRRISAFLDQARPNYMILPVVGAMGSMVLYQIARRRGIPTLFFQTARTGNQVALIDNPYDDPSSLLTPAFRKLRESGRASPRRQEAVRFIEEVRSSTRRHEAFTPLPPRPWLPIWAAQSAVRFVKHLGTLRQAGGKLEWGMEGAWDYLHNRFHRHLRLWFTPRVRFDEPVPGERFAFLALSQEPELTTLLMAPYCTNALAFIQYIAKSLPVCHKLYVKDHPWMWGYRHPSFYREVRNIPNIRLIDPRLDSRALIPKADLVCTVNGTAGWEGLIMGKPVITFGDAFYNCYPQVRRVKNPEDMPGTIQELLSSYKLDEETLIDFISIIYENTVPADYYTLWGKCTFEEMLRHPHLKVIARHAADRIREAVAKRPAPVA